MQGKQWVWIKVVALSLCVYFSVAIPGTLAQETSRRLFITGTDVSSPPSIELHVYGVDGAGAPLDLSQEAFLVEHNNRPARPAEAGGTYTAGTFTAFLIDIPSGVADQLPAIQDAIIQFSSAPTMLEQVDYVAVYQVGQTDAMELLPPNAFYNGVRNLFTIPLNAESGVTALVDSTMSLLERMPALTPNSDMVASMVVMTDGTDVVSTKFDAEDVADRAAELNIPIHTIWLNNSDLSAASAEAGEGYLAGLAAATDGLSAHLENSGELPAIWDRIAGFRNQLRVHYSVDEPTGGTFPVELMLTRSPEARAKTTVTIAANAPSIVFNLPLESRVLSLPSLEDPIKLHFSTNVSWLDGVERQITAAQLVINDTTPINIPVDDIAELDIELSDLVYGDNSIQIAVLDEQGMRVTSPTLQLTVNEGPTSIPDGLKPAGSFWGVIGNIMLGLVIIALVAAIGFFVWRNGWLTRVPTLVPRGPSTRTRRRYSPQESSWNAEGESLRAEDQPPIQPIARLDVLESVSRVPAHFALGGTHVRIGRSPTQTEITFENDITVSRIHASLMLEGEHYRIFDERSTSGTWVNEQQVPEYGIQLSDGDEIHLGAVHMRFRKPAPQA